jgi:hypothetical protein
MSLRVEHKITVEIPGTPESMEFDVSELNDNREIRSNYPLLATIIDEYRRSTLYQDSVAEGVDARTNPATFATHVHVRDTGHSDLLDNGHIAVERAPEILQSSVKALRAAQICVLGIAKGVDRFSLEYREHFMKHLEVLVPPDCAKRWLRSGRVTRLRALDAFLGQSAALFQSWRAAGHCTSRWRQENPRDVYRMQRAQSRVRYIRVKDSRFEVSERLSMPWEPVSSAHPAQIEPERDELFDNAHVGNVYLADQEGIREAARSAGYLVFRQLLLRKIKVDYCAWCGGIFEVKKKVRYCCPGCTSVGSSTEKKAEDRRQSQLRRIDKMTEVLEDWFGRPELRRNIGWREHLEKELLENKLSDARPPRRSQIVGQWVNAVRVPDELSRLIAQLRTQDQGSAESRVQILYTLPKLVSLLRRAMSIQPST